jgi:hypothetical protein
LSAICLRRSGESFAARAFAAAEAICLRRSDESVTARAFPPMLCISEAVSLFFSLGNHIMAGATHFSPLLLNRSNRKRHISTEHNELGLYKLIRPGRLYRVIGAEPQEREDGTHSTVNETIDASVFERWREDNAYRPPNLIEWAARKGAGDIGELTNSVRADDPKEAVPD